MIAKTGFHAPSLKQRLIVRQVADDSFCSVIPADFDLNIPNHPGYVFDPKTITALTLKNVEPHDDTWVGDFRDGDGMDGPDGRLACFWLVDTAPHHTIHLMCGGEATKLKRGSYVIFDDSVLHCVLSDKKWFGIAYQLRPL